MTSANDNRASVRPNLDLTARCYHDDETYNAVRTELEAYFSVGGGQTACFSDDTIATIVIGLAMTTLQAMPANLISSTLYDAIKVFLTRHNRQEVSHVAFEVNREDGKTHVSGLVETRDPEILREAMLTFRDVAMTAPGGEDWVFGEGQRKWRVFTDDERREAFVQYLLSSGGKDEKEVRDLVSRLEQSQKPEAT